MLFDETGKDCRPRLRGRNEEPDLPGDHLGEQAEGPEPVTHAVGEAVELDAIVVHHPDTPERHVAGKRDHRGACEQRLPDISVGDDLRLVEPEVAAKPS